MAETLGILFLCVCGLICVVIPCLLWLAFLAWVFADLWRPSDPTPPRSPTHTQEV